MQPVKIVLAALSVNVMMASTVMDSLVLTSTNVQHLTIDDINAANSPRVLILLDHTIANVMLVSKVMALIAKTSMNVNLRSIIVHLMLDVTIP